MTRVRKNSGFTLLEVVVATSLMALLLTTLFLGLRLGANAWRKGEAKLAEHARLLAGLELAEREVAGAVPRTLIDARDRTPVQLIAFRGSAQEARFLTRRSWQADRTRPLFMAVLSVVRSSDDDRTQRLTISEVPVADSAAMLAALSPGPFAVLPARLARPRAEAIGDAADRIELQYLDPGAVEKPAQWTSEWTPEKHDALPRALRIVWTRGKEIQTTTFSVPMWREKPELR